MRKNAFTLIELLAVIVILAIIALIAVPIVLNIINDSKASSEEESLKLYEDAVQKMIVKRQMADPLFSPSECKIKNDGNLECTVGTKKVIVEIEVKETKPNKGKVTIEGNKISFKNVELNGKVYYQIIKLVNDVSPTGISKGDEYEYEVSPGTRYIFYVLSIKNDQVSLIMDRNICNDGTVAYTELNNYCRYAWESNNINGNGPIDAMQTIGNATRNWTNVPNMNLVYNDREDLNASTYGYTGITIEDGVGYITKKDGTTQTPITLIDNKPIKARLPRHSEIKLAGCSSTVGACPAWLIGNMTYHDVSSAGVGMTDKYSMNNNNEAYQGQIKGYWTLSSYSNKSNLARSVYYYGIEFTQNTNLTVYYGVRPVITVPASDLS